MLQLPRWIFLFSLSTSAHAGILDGISNAFNKVKDAVGDKDVEVRVDSHKWVRTVNIETLKKTSEEGWCKDRPGDAYDLSVIWKERSAHKVEQRIANGQEYTYAEFVDYYAPAKRLAEDGKPYAYAEFSHFYKGEDGLAEKKWIEATIVDQPKEAKMAEDNWEKAQRKDCSGNCCPRCHDAQEWDFWCKYSVDRWETTNVAEASEDNAYPYWPEVRIEECKLPSLGCERKGGTTESFRVDLSMIENGASSKTHCAMGDIAFPAWQLLVVGQLYPASRRVAYGLLCGSIKIPDPWRKSRIANDNKAYTYAEFVDFYGKDAAPKWQAASWAKSDEL